MKIWIHRYQLQPRLEGLRPRAGALLKVEWFMGQVGYSDIHPWPEFGEPELDEHLKGVAALHFTPLVENSFEFNYWDREFRLLKRSAFLGLVLPRSHRLVFKMDELNAGLLKDWSALGFTHLKVKMGGDLKRETEILTGLAYSSPILWRLDFGGRLTSIEFLKWWGDLDASVKARVDFVEDPSADGLNVSGPWADDWKRSSSARVRVLKPARDVEEELGQYSRVVFTHSLDHPFGQACALWAAGRYYSRHPKRLDVCGLAAPDVYLDDDFSAVWRCEGPRMKPAPGYGFGFDDVLAGLAWERVL